MTNDITAAYARLTGYPFTPISRDGPQLLPGGIVAFKFRDPDGHPLELIQPVSVDPATRDGIDHSAISVSDVAGSVAFYEAALGLTSRSRQVNTGPAQDALDGLDGTAVDVLGLFPSGPGPHVELLGYKTPAGLSRSPGIPADIAATRLVFSVAGLAFQPGTVRLADGSTATLQHDPDRHALLLVEEP